jgi:hypothetical protein
MSAAAIDMFDFVATLRASIPDVIHPSAKLICGEYCTEMRLGMEAGDMTDIPRLVRLFRAKIVDELRWEAQKRETPGMGAEMLAMAITLRHQADAFEAGHA